MDFLTFFGPPVEFSKILLERLSLLNDHISWIRFFFFLSTSTFGWKFAKHWIVSVVPGGKG